jgi:anti-sigma B factor antagonist
MVIKHSVHNGVDHVELGGQLNMTSAAEARAGLRGIIEQGAQRLVLDFGGVDFVDSSGLSVLVSAYKLIDAKGGKMVLANLPPNVQSLFALTRLNEAFQVFASTQSAIEYLTDSA